ncbi:uncharacterized protein LOC100836864 [Brachypodium distachyon]|uniref:Uncharacterized protein n=1 Tax=Brachypodium distachyon TaxID=15368 RepID=I1HVK3_BRADI|nr:uncharacterized protein LOC100836864 [Brachypodium distachyon]KQK11723.1 hypothetical protein BRADI_2g61910v3 [Brachypodium distachyon]|eukprot:XP_010233617.2 uncharacterized protein LOC100836864 [Brachypodium distachyon]
MRRLVCFLVVAAMVVALASAQGQKPKMAVAAKKGSKPPAGGKFETVTMGKFSKRKYEITCTDNGAPGCVVSCPDSCPNKCITFCGYCMTFCMCDLFPGMSCGDPRFTGGDGNTFYFHGKKEKDFCIVSDKGLHINAHFIGNHNPEMKRDFTWVQALGVTFRADDGGAPHRLYVGARRAVEWDEDEDHIQIALDGEPVEVEAAKKARWVSGAVPALSVTRTDTVNTVTVELDGVFSISANAVPITDEDSRVHRYGKTGKDSLVHLDLGFKFHALTDLVDGVLGQTYRPNYVTKVNVTANMPIMGGAPKYLSAGLFSTDCAVSQFRRGTAGAAIETFAS